MMDGELEGHLLEAQGPRQSRKQTHSITRRIVAPLLSLVLPGVGQLYNRNWLKGTLFIVVVMLFSGWLRRTMIVEGADSVAAMTHSPYVVLALIVLLGFGVWSVLDAYRTAKLVSKH
jgi:hypothetical protein